MAHAMAMLTPRSRRVLVELVEEHGWSPAAVADRMAVSRATVHKWLRRYRQEGWDGLADRSSRPRRSPNRTPEHLEREIIRLRVQHRWGPHRISYATGMARSTVYRVLRRYDLNRLGDMTRTRRQVVRYQREVSGELVHIDVKKLPRIPPGGGHRVWGRQARPSLDRKTGHDYFHVAVDDHSRVAFVQVHPDQRGDTCARFTQDMVRFFASLGVRVQEVMTDNAKNYVNHRGFQGVLARHGIKHRRTRIYRPQTNGKVERFNLTLKQEWAYNPAIVSNERRLATLQPWVDLYNRYRPHSAHQGKAPLDML